MATRSHEKAQKRIADELRSTKLWPLFFVLLCAFSWPFSAFAQLSFDDIEFWVGSGRNRAALAIDWDENSSTRPALVWGFRWDGVALGDDMLTAVIAADPRLYAKLGGTHANPTAMYGLGYDANGNDQFALDDGTAFDAQGFAFTSPSDLASSVDAADYYAEGWFTGFWHYGIAQSNPYAGGTWMDTPVGMTERVLIDGAWDSWTFTPTFNFAAFAENPAAAPAPFRPGDFSRDGRVDAADYARWRSDFGSTVDLAADANGNGIVDAADYVVWLKQFQLPATPATVPSLSIPEPHAAVLALCSLWPLWRLCKQKEMIS